MSPAPGTDADAPSTVASTPAPTDNPQPVSTTPTTGGSARFFSLGARGTQTVRWSFVDTNRELYENRTPLPGFTWQSLIFALVVGMFAGLIFGLLMARAGGFPQSQVAVLALVGALSLGVGYVLAELMGKTVEVLGLRRLIFFALPIGKVPVAVMTTFVMSFFIVQGQSYVFVLSGALYFALYALGVMILNYRSYFESQRNSLF
ncbi:hypothetical protein [Rothia sp. ZJ1223]|uniref:hypothetical protein n=1 Tax=Rothia sp. ZJ1223 TaxID=2811098 RepID=UPI00195DF120|nr:hypothetical protein [Rothia sp. ZJ1223]MBM7051773.1 hypothetical protein [Rothia sp. ZJ1223]